MERLPLELLNQLPLTTQVFYAVDSMLYAKLAAPGEAWFFYIRAIDSDGTCVYGFVDVSFTRFHEFQCCLLNELNELNRRWGWGMGGASLMRNAAFRPCCRSQVKLIWGR
jgi:hypothetical protein